MTDEPLDATAVRVLGALIEKESTTPDVYPLTLNALVLACNQSSNRDPVMSLDEQTVDRTLEELAERSLVRQVYKSESRAKRYRHTMTETLHLHPAELAVMCVLMLRGPQTAGEIRTRTTRLFEFRDVPHVDVTLQVLMTMTTPLVAQLARRPGQKETRYAQLMSGEPAEDTSDSSTAYIAAPAKADRIDALEQAVESLRSEMGELRAQLDEFRKEFQ